MIGRSIRLEMAVGLVALMFVTVPGTADVTIDMPPPPKAAVSTPASMSGGETSTEGPMATAGQLALARYGRARSGPRDVYYHRRSPYTPVYGGYYGYYGASGYPYYYRSPYSTYAPFGCYHGTWGFYGSGLYTFRVRWVN